MKLTTPNGSVEGHCACAKALEENIENHLLNPAPLGPFSQNILLAEVLPSFTEGDNEMLLSLPNKDEVHKILKSCRPHSAPGTDSITACFYQQNWDLIGDHLTEVIQKVFLGNKPTPSQKTSLMVFGNKPGKKAKSLLISDRRKLSLLNVDFKVMTGTEAARIKKTMSRTILPLQLVSGGEKRVSHGIAMAMDAMEISGNKNPGCAILDTDLKAAFCNMVTTWTRCFQVLLKKGISEQVISRYKNLYEDNVSLVVVNNIIGKAVKNNRQSIRQGDKFAMELFSFGMDPILDYLERRLTGILIHSAPVQGPLLLPAPLTVSVL